MDDNTVIEQALAWQRYAEEKLNIYIYIYLYIRDYAQHIRAEIIPFAVMFKSEAMIHMCEARSSFTTKLHLAIPSKVIFKS